MGQRRAAGPFQLIRICFHGAESTGKSVLAEQLSRELGVPWVPEYGRAYAEQHGTQFTMADLLAIARGQDAAMQAAAALAPPVLLLDTDPLMTAAWAEMLFGAAPAELFAYPRAELYLAFAADTPWVEDGTRMFGTSAARQRFARVAAAVLARAGVQPLAIAGSWASRADQVRAIIAGNQGLAGSLQSRGGAQQGSVTPG